MNNEKDKDLVGGVVKVTEKPKDEKVVSGIIVGDPQLLRPVELPLVVKPRSGKWENEEQAEYAKLLNAYAYQNPVKWAVKKETLIGRLEEIGKNPLRLYFYKGVQPGSKGKLTVKNKLIEK